METICRFGNLSLAEREIIALKLKAARGNGYRTSFFFKAAIEI